MDRLNAISLIISVSSFLIPLLVGFKNRKTILWLYILTGFVFDIGLMLLKRVFHIDIFPLANVYVLAEFLLLFLYYYLSIGRQYHHFFLVTLLIAALYIIQTLVNGIDKRNGIGAASFYALYLVYALLGFYTISKKHQYQLITSSAFFWANVAVLLGSSGRVILFLFEDYLIVHQQTHLGYLWVVYRMFNVLINVLFAVALSRRYE